MIKKKLLQSLDERKNNAQKWCKESTKSAVLYTGIHNFYFKVGTFAEK